MDTLVEIVCNTKEEADFSVAYCQKKEYSNVVVCQIEQYSVIEVEGKLPDFRFTGRFSRMGENLFIVRAEK